MKTQTYEEAVLKTVMWWSEKIQQPLNQDNGDTSKNGGMAFMLMNMVANNAQESTTPEQIKIFEDTLTKKLMEVENNRYRESLHVDYHPDQMLSESASESGINPSVFPCKTWTRIGIENEVSVSFGYGTEPSII